MEYDEIDGFVDGLFKKDQEPSKSDGPLHGEVLSGDWRIDRINDIIEDAYNEAIWWHNGRISEGCDPRSGLRNLPYVPWDENIDGVAAMQGAIGGLSESSFMRNGGHIHQYAVRSSEQPKERGLGCAEVLIITVVAVICLIFMLVAS